VLDLGVVSLMGVPSLVANMSMGERSQFEVPVELQATVSLSWYA
jgi:hypothetical protein